MKKIIFLILILCINFVYSANYKNIAKNPKNPIAVLNTSMGKIVIELYKENAPKTVKNFIDLATGKKAYLNPKTKKKEKGKYYNGIIFHRVIPNFMIQTGDPTGTGRGGPGYKFKDEINADSLGLNKLKVKDAKYVLRMYPPDVIKKYLKKSVKKLYESSGYNYIKSVKSIPALRGAVAMANSGHDTNGSQFFINGINTPWLNGKHTVFGYVIKGMDIVKKIAYAKTGANNKPIKPIVIKNVKIIE